MVPVKLQDDFSDLWSRKRVIEQELICQCVNLLLQFCNNEIKYKRFVATAL